MRDYDCIVVGARCAGAALAVHLGRAGMRVLVIEADALHSDQPFSTHAIQASGMELLDALGVGQQIRACAPPVKVTRLEVRGHVLDVPLPEGRYMYCPRRSTLDPLLQDAAIAAGVELRTLTRVTELLRDGDAVVGVRAVHAGQSESYRAPWVIGADGRNSSVARMVGARDYIQHEAERGGYWSYWRKPACWDRDEPWRRFQTVIGIDETVRFAFECDADLLVVGAVPPFEQARAWGKRYAEEALLSLRASRLTAALVESEPIVPFVGLLKAHFFMREAVGRGWALVGDAGLHKDPTPGHGITDALRDATELAHALVDGRREALDVYWRKRDVAAVPLYFQALSMGQLSYANPFNELIIDNVGRDPVLVRRMEEVINRRRSPYNVLSDAQVFRWIGRALLQRRWNVLRPFLAAGQYSRMVAQELEERERLLQEAETHLHQHRIAPAVRPLAVPDSPL